MIHKIQPQNNYTLLITNEKNQMGVFDVKPYFHSDVFLELKNADNFQKIYNGKYFIEWECGADLCVDTIEAKWKPLW